MNSKVTRREIFGIQFDGLSMEETIEKFHQIINNKQKIIYADLNVHSVLMHQSDEKIRNFFNSAEILNLDGQGVVFAYRLLKLKRIERTTGCDLMFKLIEEAAKKGLSCYFLGARQDVLEDVIHRVELNYGKKTIAGFHNGYFNKEMEPKIVEEINNSGADILFIGITSPKKEIFLLDHFHKLNTLFNMGVGGSFDVFAGHVKRAPHWMQKIGLEWLFRVIQEPKRMWKRYLISNSQFFLLLICQLFTKK